MADDIASASFQRRVKRLCTESDAAVALIASTWLEELTRRLLQVSLVPGPKRDPLFDDGGSLDTLYKRILMLERLGVLGSDVARALNLARQVRNSFAHGDLATFDDRGIRERVLELAKPIRGIGMFEMLMHQLANHEQPGVAQLNKSPSRQSFISAIITVLSFMETYIHIGQQQGVTIVSTNTITFSVMRGIADEASR